MEQNEIKPVELCIEEEEVVKRYPVTEALEIVRCKTSIFFHSTGFFVVSKPTIANNFKGGALFETLKWYCDYMDERDSYPPDEQEKYDTFAAMIINLLSIPLDVFTDIDLMLDIADFVLRRRQTYYEKLEKEAAEPRQDTLEDALKDAEFEAEVEASEALKKELTEMSKRNGTKS